MPLLILPYISPDSPFKRLSAHLEICLWLFHECLEDGGGDLRIAVPDWDEAQGESGHTQHLHVGPGVSEHGQQQLDHVLSARLGKNT